ncbi:MAG: hypothetical protein HND51_12530 [Chloroflexi bacterium]|nr:hypothetical protein [Chloroflexota bacterium]
MKISKSIKRFVQDTRGEIEGKAIILFAIIAAAIALLALGDQVAGVIQQISGLF